MILPRQSMKFPRLARQVERVDGWAGRHAIAAREAGASGWAWDVVTDWACSLSFLLNPWPIATPEERAERAREILSRQA